MKIGLAAALVAGLAMTMPALAKKGGGMSGNTDLAETGFPGGFSHGNKHGWNGGTTPPGWSKGKKHGWSGGTMPPGLSR